MDDDYGGFAFVKDVLCSLQDKLAIPNSCLDNQSTVDVFYHPRLLDKIREAKQVLTPNCNAGRL